MGEGPPAPLGCLHGWSPAGSCLPTHAECRARLRQTVLPPVHPLRSIRRSQGRGVSPQIALHMWQLFGPGRRSHAQTTAPSALAARLTPHSPPNPTFALLAEYRGLPVTRPAEHAPRRADLEYRCIGAHAASPARRSACEIPSDRSLRGESRRSDGTATTLRSSRADLAVFRPAMRLGRPVAHPVVVGAVQVAPTPRIRPREVPRHGGSEAHGASKSRPSDLMLALVGYWLRMVNARPGART